MRNLYVSILAFVFLSACQREFSSDVYDATRGVSNHSVAKPEPVKANLQGNIYDENGQPAENVSVKVGAQTISTDANGYFRIDNASLDKSSSFVSAEKSGYFTAYRSFCANTGTNQVVIKLLKKISAGTINSVSGGEVSLSNGSKIGLPVNGIVNAATGKAYAGAVTVYASYIDPTSQEIAQTVPGSFMADDKDGNRVVLASYGMLAVELESATGEKLQIASGSSAKLTTAIPQTLQSTAPATIPLWYVNPQTGIWKEEGSATKIGNNYVGDVKHFTFWNCDRPSTAVILSFILKNAENIPMANALIKVQSRGAITVFGYTYTDSLGRFTEYVPVNQVIDLLVVNPCLTSILSKSVGPFAKNTDAEDVSIPTTLSVVTIKGQIAGCSAKTSSNTYAVISLDNMIHYAAADSKGNFSTSFIQCSGAPNIMKVFGIDVTNSQQGKPVTINATPPLTNVGTISACDGVLQEYIKYNIDSTDHLIIDSLDAYPLFRLGNSGPNTSYILGNGVLSPNEINLGFDNDCKEGTYPITQLRVLGIINTSYRNATVTITKFPVTAGTYYEGSFSVEFIVNGNGTVGRRILTGKFRIKRRM